MKAKQYFLRPPTAEQPGVCMPADLRHLLETNYLEMSTIGSKWVQLVPLNPLGGPIIDTAQFYHEMCEQEARQLASIGRGNIRLMLEKVVREVVSELDRPNLIWGVSFMNYKMYIVNIHWETPSNPVGLSVVLTEQQLVYATDMEAFVKMTLLNALNKGVSHDS